MRCKQRTGLQGKRRSRPLEVKLRVRYPCPNGSYQRVRVWEGSMNAVRDAGPMIDESEIVDLERQIGDSLPSDYRAFLMRFNGGLLEPDIVDVPGFAESPTDVQVLFGVRRDIESSDISWNWNVYKNRIPHDFLPIASDSGGNLYCVKLAEPNKGEILYMDFTGAPRSYRVAAAFTKFLDSLRPFER
jgi:cell wall assembly regulator SMI1